jgi:hypothetical protein
VEKFFKVATISADSLASRIKAAESRPGDDLTIIQSFPLIEIVPQRYLCLDPGFLIEKAGRAFGWALLSKLSDEERRDVLAFWGSVFEEYVNLIIQESYHGDGRFVPEVKFPNGDASFDCCIVEGRDLMVFEHKSSVIRADAKYGGDVPRLERELRLKFIEGEPGDKKGIAQISNSIQRFLGGEDMDGISSREISRIYPVMVCLETSATVPYFARYLRDNFKATYPRKKYPQVVTPLFTLGVADVENLSGCLGLFKFSEILESYRSGNSAMLTSISNSDVPILKNVTPVQSIVDTQFEKFTKKIERDFFGVGDD